MARPFRLRMRLLAVVGILLTAASLAGCAPIIESGVVVSYSHSDSYYTGDSIIYVGSSMMIIPGTQVPESWSIRIRDEEGNEGNITFDHDPSSEYPIGSHYPRE